MFKIGDKVKMKPYYGESIESILGLQCKATYIVHDLDLYEKELYLVFLIMGELIYLKSEFFDLVKKVGFLLAEVD